MALLLGGIWKKSAKSVVPFILNSPKSYYLEQLMSLNKTKCDLFDFFIKYFFFFLVSISIMLSEQSSLNLHFIHFSLQFYLNYYVKLFACHLLHPRIISFYNYFFFFCVFFSLLFIINL